MSVKTTPAPDTEIHSMLIAGGVWMTTGSNICDCCLIGPTGFGDTEQESIDDYHHQVLELAA